MKTSWTQPRWFCFTRQRPRLYGAFWIVFLSVLLQPPFSEAAETLRQLSVNAHRQLIMAQLSEPVSSTVHHRIHQGHLQVIWDLEGVDVAPEFQGESAWLEALKRQWPDLISVSAARFSGPVLRLRFELKGDQLSDPVVMHHDSKTPYLAFSSTESTSPAVSNTLLMTESTHSLRPVPPATLSDTMNRMYGSDHPVQRYQTFTLPKSAEQASPLPPRSAEMPAFTTKTVVAPPPSNSSSAALQQQVNDLSQKLAYWQEKYQTFSRQQQHQPDHEKQAFQLGLQLSKTREELNRIQTENHQLFQQLQAMMAEQTRQANSLPDSQESQTDHEKRAFELGLQLSKTREALAALQTEKDALSTQIQTLMAQQDTAEKITAHQQKQQQQVAQLQQDKEQLSRTITTLKAQLAQSQKPTPSVENQADNSDEPVAAVALAHVPDPEAHVDQLQTLKKALEQSKQSLLKSIQTINRQNQAIARLNEQLIDIKEGIGQSSLEQQTYLNDQLTKAEARQEDLEKSVQRLEMENRSLKLVVNGLQKKLPEGATQDILSQGGLPDLPANDVEGSVWVSKHMDNAQQEQKLDASTRLESDETPVYQAEPSL